LEEAAQTLSSNQQLLDTTSIHLPPRSILITPTSIWTPTTQYSLNINQAWGVLASTPHYLQPTIMRLVALAAGNGLPQCDNRDLLASMINGLRSSEAVVTPECAAAAAARAAAFGICGGDGAATPPAADVAAAAAAAAGAAGCGVGLGLVSAAASGPKVTHTARTLPTVLLYDERGLALFDRITREAADEVGRAGALFEGLQCVCLRTEGGRKALSPPCCLHPSTFFSCHHTIKPTDPCPTSNDRPRSTT